jgi:hypothetical protein
MAISAHCCTGTAALAWLLLLSSMEVTSAAAPCYTHDEARKLWPKVHLYWHGSARCWDAAAPGRPRPLTSTSTSATPSGGPLDESLPTIAFPAEPRTVIYPELIAGSTGDEMFNPASILTWRPLIDIDTADPAHFSAWNQRVNGQWGQPTSKGP